MEKIAMISDSYHDFARLLLLTIIVNSKSQMISIIVKENIMVNRQNRLIAHPYLVCRAPCLSIHLFLHDKAGTLSSK